MNKASEGDGIPVELFQILKDDAVKVLHSGEIPHGRRSSRKHLRRPRPRNFAGILSAALSQHHLLGLEIAQLEFHHLH